MSADAGSELDARPLRLDRGALRRKCRRSRRCCGLTAAEGNLVEHDLRGLLGSMIVQDSMVFARVIAVLKASPTGSTRRPALTSP